MQGFKMSLLLAAAGFGMSFAVQAQTVMRPMFGLGLVRGGDEIAPKVPGTPLQSPTRASGLLHGYAGALYLPSANSAVSFNVGIQAGATKNKNRETYEFSRFPLELGYHLEIFDVVTIGGGVRKSLNPTLKVKPAEKAYQPSIKSDVGAFASVKVGGEHTSLVLKYVVEGFKSPELGKINGNHFGIYLEFAQ